MKRSFVLAVLALALPSSALSQPGKEKLAFRTASVQRGSLNATVSATGTLQPEEVIDVGAQVAGTVVKFGAEPRDGKKTIDFGTPVEEGTVLAQLEPTLYKVRVEQAKARVSRAESESRLTDVQSHQAELVWTRLEKVGRAVASEELARARYEFELARVQSEIQRAAIKEAEAALQEAELNLSLTTIRSPIKGVLLERRVDLGQTVAPSLNRSSLFVIARDLKRMQVWAQVHEADIALVKPGQAATFTVAAYPKEVFKGDVANIRLNANTIQGGVTYNVVLQAENPAGKLLPFMTADVRLTTAQKKSALLVPNAALTWLPEASQVTPSSRGQFYELEALRKDSRVKRVVWVEEKGYVRPVVINVGLSDGQATEVVDGELKEGAGVVVGN